jgi:hypothetical protein
MAIDFAEEIHRVIDRYRRHVEKRVMAEARKATRTKLPRVMGHNTVAKVRRVMGKPTKAPTVRSCTKCGKPGHYARSQTFHPRRGSNGNGK